MDKGFLNKGSSSVKATKTTINLADQVGVNTDTNPYQRVDIQALKDRLQRLHGKRDIEGDTAAPELRKDARVVLNPSTHDVHSDSIWGNTNLDNTSYSTTFVGGLDSSTKTADVLMSGPNVVNTSTSGPNVLGETNEVRSFANVLNPERVSRKVNFRALVNEMRIENHDTVLPKAAMEGVFNRYENTLVGFFVGKNVAFHLVQNYVSNMWGKFGFKKLMKNDDGVFLFKFDSKEGVESVLQRGSWIIRNSPLILTKWTPDVLLSKSEVT